MRKATLEPLPPEDRLMPCFTCPNCGRDALLYERVKGVTYVYCDAARKSPRYKYGCKFKRTIKAAWLKTLPPSNEEGGNTG